MDSIARNMKAVSVMLACGLLVACQAQPRPDGTGAETRASERAPTERPEGRVYRVYRVDREHSELRIVVHPAGALARFGHPHVIGGSVIDGEVVLVEPFHDSALRLHIDVGALEVDRPEWRADEGFDPDLEPSAINGTRDNLRSTRVLNVAEYPVIRVDSVALRGPHWQPDIDLRIELRGQARELTVPISLTLDDEQLIAAGRFSLRQSDFGIEPFSVAGGSLQVADELLIRFRIQARR